VSAGGVDLVLLRTRSGLRVYEGRCPHQGALLGEGEIEDGSLVCRNHRWRFDVETGERIGGKAHDPSVHTYKNFDVARAGSTADVREHMAFTMTPVGLRARVRRRSDSAPKGDAAQLFTTAASISLRYGSIGCFGSRCQGWNPGRK
jgi:nitrite reductase/ring-hydroxylating ferredoxin subunit